MKDYKLIRNFINKEEHNSLINWINENQSNFLFNDHGGHQSKFTRLTDFPKSWNGCDVTDGHMRKESRKCDIAIPNIITQLKQKVIKQFDFLNEATECDIFVCLYNSNSYVNMHKHFTQEGLKDLRFNLIVKQPNIGGYLVCEGGKVDFKPKVKDLCAFNGNNPHGVTTHTGDRWVLSFGFQVPKDISFI